MAHGTKKPWLNPSAWSDKLEWIQKYFGKDDKSPLYKKLIISHHKELLNDGNSYLVDDRPDKNGSDAFREHLIQFGSDKFPDWNAVVEYFRK